MNSHLYREHITTLYEQLKEKYTDEEILAIIRQSVRTSSAVKGEENEDQ